MASSPPERILVRGVNWLGDAVMTTPALLRLREARPAAHLALLTHEKLAALWQQHPALDSVQTFASGEGAWQVGRRISREKFDLGLVLPNSPRSALELWFGGIPRRVGYSRAWRNLFLTQRVQRRPEARPMHKRSAAEINSLLRQSPAPAAAVPPASAHHIYQYLHLTAALGANPEPLSPRLAVPGNAATQLIAKFNLASSSTADLPWFGLNAGAEYGPAKRWPEDRFAEAAIQIQRRTPCRWLVFGLKTDGDLAARITARIQLSSQQHFGPDQNASPFAFNLAGATSLSELCAALQLCRVLLTNDSGPMHVAAALGTPVVVPFGSTSPELTGPGLPGDSSHHCLRVPTPCAPCFLRVCPIDFRCMTGITVERVVDAVLRAARPFTEKG